MSLLQPAEQSPDTERMFDADTKAMGYLSNYTRLFAHSPAVLSAAGAEPDPQYEECLDVDLRQALSFGG
ncbi:hypothetical protein ACTMS0_14470 [Micromonospora sp. H33]|uniref:hypothetical protein n=1 Tax=Micromonospora sp. H33 TaxID=3452215 RepID=UPI003F8AAA7B